MAERCQLTAPIVGGPARLQADQARWKFLEKRFQLGAPELLADDDFARSVHAMHLVGWRRRIAAPPLPENRTCGSPRIRLKPFFSTMVWYRTT